MEQITMDTYEMQSLSVEVFEHLIFARNFNPSIDVLKKVLDHYNTIIACPQERLLDTIIFERQVIASTYGSSIPGVSPTVYFSNVMWEYVYTLAYYLNNNSAIWRAHLLPRMKELARNNAIRDDMNKAEKLVDQYIDRRIAFEMDLDNHIEQPANFDEINQLNQQIKTLKAKITELETENATLKTRIAEFESQNKHAYLSFIQTEGKSPDQIKWAYMDIKKAIAGPAEMAECLHNLQVQGKLKNQERYGKLKKIKKIYEELQQAYGFDWKYDALRRALNRINTPK